MSKWYFVASQPVSKKALNFLSTPNPPGIENASITCFYQEPSGILWIGSQDGLTRWDGRTGIPFHKNAIAGRKLPGNHIFKVAPDPSDAQKLWVLTSEGLSVISTLTLQLEQHFPTGTKYGKEAMETSTQFLSAGKDIWLGTYSGLQIFNPKEKRVFQPKWVPYDAAKKEPNNFIDLMHGDREYVWVFFRKYGLVVYNRNYDTVATLPLASFAFRQGYPFQHFLALYPQAPEKWLLVTDEHIANIQWQHASENLLLKTTILYDPPHNGTLRNAARLYNDTLILSGFGGLFAFDMRTEKITQLYDPRVTKTDDWTTKINVLQIDKDKNWWLAAPDGIHTYNPRYQFAENFYMSADGTEKLSRLYHLFPQDSQTVWASDFSGFYALDIADSRIQKIFSDGPYFFSDTLAKDLMLVSHVNGTFLMRQKKRLPLITYFPELQPLEKEVINSMVRVNHDTYLIASELGNGVYVWKRAARVLQKLDKAYCGNRLANETINGMKLLKDGRVIILSEFEFAVYNGNNNTLINYAPKLSAGSKPVGVYMDVAERNGSYWFACYGTGVVQCNEKFEVMNIIAGEQGLGNLATYRIFPAGSKYLLTTTNNGLFLIDADSGKASAYTSRQGLQTNRYEEGAGTNAFNRIYTGGFDGFSIIDPMQMPVKELAPFLSINALKVKSARTGEMVLPFTPDTKWKLSSATEQVNVLLDIVDFFPHERDELAYRLLPVQTQWQYGKVSSVIPFTGLPPGGYTFESRIRKQMGTWSPVVSFSFEIRPKWYQTVWIKIAVWLSIAAFFYGLYRYRLWQIQKEVKLRKQIAADLHDDLGGTLTGIKMYAELGAATGSSEYFAPVRQGLQDAAIALREMIWVLDNQTNSLPDILRKAESNAQQLLHTKDIALYVHMEAGIDTVKLKAEAKRDLYLLIKEFINNSVKYADCSEIIIEARFVGKALHIRLSDNGKGFDVSAVQRGNGLNNMETRARKAGFEPIWKNETVGGTTLLLLRNR